MKNHVGNMRKQAKEGLIRLDLTEDLAKIFMWWLWEFLRRLDRQGIKVIFYNKCYIDDIITMFKVYKKQAYEVCLNRSAGRQARCGHGCTRGPT